jgi:hypothetical protein
LVSAVAPIYLTGTFQGIKYNDSYVALSGLDISLPAISSFLDFLGDRLTVGSFGLLVDADFNVIVISQAVVDMIYPKLTGFETERVTYSADGAIIVDRRNQTYLPSDTIHQGLTKLSNANWTGLLQSIRSTAPGDRDYTTFNITLTGDIVPTEYYVWFERWKYVADWVVLVFAPKAEVLQAINVVSKAYSPGKEQYASAVYLEGQRGPSLYGQGEISNKADLMFF